MDMVQALFGKNPVIRTRGVVGTTQLNLNALIQPVTSIVSAIFDAAYALDVSSSSAADVTTGAKTIEIYGLDAGWNPVSEIVTLNGQTKVTTTTLFRRVFAAIVQTSGTGRLNAGDIYIGKTGTGGTITGGVPATLTSYMLKMLVGNNFATNGLFTAPAGCIYTLNNLIPTGRAAGTIVVIHGKSNNCPAEELKIEVGASGIGAVPFSSPILTLNPKEDLYFQGIGAAAGAILNVTAQFTKVSPA